ncbi:MAG: glycine zipper family protein [Nitrospirota bacterium]|nr:glycine zipper family protein [Nitrospirota bacterium]MDH5586671.1 glycine zipper family protein [Nitrospirota bacterium]
MKKRTRILSLCLMLIFGLIVGCAGPQPVLYPNAHLQEVGKDLAEEDVAACEELAEDYVSKSNAGEKVATRTVAGGAIGAAGGAVGGAIAGNVGIGAAIGAAVGATQGFLQGLFGASRSEPSPAYRNFVNRCLKERGYEPMGWD